MIFQFKTKIVVITVDKLYFSLVSHPSAPPRQPSDAPALPLLPATLTGEDSALLDLWQLDDESKDAATRSSQRELGLTVLF